MSWGVFFLEKVNRMKLNGIMNNYLIFLDECNILLSIEYKYCTWC
jgi:hypothetical protein